MNTLLKATNWLCNRILLLTVISLMAFSAFSIWDNNQVFSEAENVQSDLLSLKPEAENLSEGFEELRKIDGNICAWLTVDNTAIDYPVVQGESNLSYLNKDVYGNFSLAGSIYMDSRNHNNLKDRYTLVYGHHMDNHLMFGDLDLFKDEEFFNLNPGAQILLSEEKHDFKLLAVMEIPDSTEEVFEPAKWSDGFSRFGSFIENNALNFSEEQMERLLLKPYNVQIVALVTCSDGATGNRTVVFLMREVEFEFNETDPTAPSNHDSTEFYSPQTGDRFNLIIECFVISVILLCVTLLFKKYHKQ